MDRKRQKLSLEKNEAEVPCQEEEIAILRQKLLTVEAELKLNNTEKLDLRKRVTTLEQELAEKEDLHKRVTTVDRECTVKEDQLNLVSNGKGDSIDDASYIAIPKGTFENIKTELSQSHNKISELTAKIQEQEEGMSALQRENIQLTAELKQKNEEKELLMKRVTSLEQELEKKETQLDLIKEPFNACPNEVMLEIFKRMTQNELGKMARVCRKWNDLTKSPVLWRNVNVKFHSSYTSQTVVFKSLIKGLPCNVTSIKVEFENFEYIYQIQPLDFQELCISLQEKCPNLNQLILLYSKLSVTLSSIVDLCSHFLPSLTSLVFELPELLDIPATVQYGSTSEIEVLAVIGIFSCISTSDIRYFRKLTFSKMPKLKKLYLSRNEFIDDLFEGDVSFLNRLEVLDLSWTFFGSIAFEAIRNHLLNLKELYVCMTKIDDNHLKGNTSSFLQLNTVCLKSCHDVTSEGVVSLVKSCPSLQNIYVDEPVARSYAKHPFIIANKCKLDIVKTTVCCCEHYKKCYRSD